MGMNNQWASGPGEPRVLRTGNLRIRQWGARFPGPPSVLMVATGLEVRRCRRRVFETPGLFSRLQATEPKLTCVRPRRKSRLP